VIGVATARSDTWYTRYGKRVLDLGVGAVLLVLSAPVQLVVAAVVRARLGSPVLLHQRRIGLNGRLFTIVKFRTMLPDRRVAPPTAFVGQDRRSGLPSYDDPRHTRVGSVLRRWSLDELPQLLNVMRGDMSLVGPRPDMASHAARYEPWEHERHTVKPGLTGVWQIESRDQRGALREFAAVDIAYARSVSLRTDLRVLLRTPLALIRRPAPAPAHDDDRDPGAPGAILPITSTVNSPTRSDHLDR
jgi:lipopolysaccharide/colanic/teichoic acid biosynthesis glycosyltransferase